MFNVRSVDDLTATARIRDAAIEQFGRVGFDVGLRTIAKAAGVSAALVIHHFGSKDALRAACDAHVADIVRTSKSQSLQSPDPATWFAQLAEMESFAPLTAYLARSMQSGGDLAKSLWRDMIDNAEQYLDEAVRAGTIKPSPDPRARARFLALTGGGAFLLYLQLHDDPSDIAAVLHDYAQDMVLPALEIYTEGLLTDSTMYDAFVAQRATGEPIPTSKGND